jgi:hypothetical protein
MANIFSGSTAGKLDAERKLVSFEIGSLQARVAGKRPETLAKFRPLFEVAPFNNEDQDSFLSYCVSNALHTTGSL